MNYDRKVFPLILIVLSFTGIALCFFLQLNRIVPAQILTALHCSPGTCSPFINTPYARTFGISFISVQLFFFLWIFLSYFLFSESGSQYRSAFRMILPFIAVAAFVHITVYVAAMLRLQVCPYTLAIALIDILILIFAVFSVLRSSGSFVALLARYSDGQKHLFISDDRRFSFGTFVYFSAVLFLFIVSFSLFIDLRFNAPMASGDDTNERKTLLERYLDTPRERIQFPESSMIAGAADAPMTIDVFTDPMCGACEAFHKNHTKILEKYKDRVRIRFFYHPLDPECNSSVSSALHPGACLVTEIFYAAAQTGVYEKTVAAYYDRKKTVRQLIATGQKIDSLIDAIVDDADDAKRMKDAVLSKKAHAELAAHMESGLTIDIRATPTLFIDERRIEGAPSLDSLSKILDHVMKEKGIK